MSHSAQKLNRSKPHHSKGEAERRHKKSKHTISIINLSKHADEPKLKGSSTATKRKQSKVELSDRIK